MRLVISAASIIKDHRSRKGMSLADVAALLGVSESAVSHWETGRFAPRRAAAIKLDAVLGADGEILRSLGYVAPSSAPNAEALMAAIDALADRVTTLEGEVAALLGAQEDRTDRERRGPAANGAP